MKIIKKAYINFDFNLVSGNHKKTAQSTHTKVIDSLSLNF